MKNLFGLLVIISIFISLISCEHEKDDIGVCEWTIWAGRVLSDADVEKMDLEFDHFFYCDVMTEDECDVFLEQNLGYKKYKTSTHWARYYESSSCADLGYTKEKRRNGKLAPPDVSLPYMISPDGEEYYGNNGFFAENEVYAVNAPYPTQSSIDDDGGDDNGLDGDNDLFHVDDNGDVYYVDDFGYKIYVPGYCTGEYDGPPVEDDIQVNTQCLTAFVSYCAGEVEAGDQACEYYKGFEEFYGEDLPECPYCKNQ